MKIMIAGYSGSGKSTLAKTLGELHKVPILHLDSVRFLPNWQERPTEEFKQVVLQFMQQDKWIIDGNFSEAYYLERLKQSDKIILLLFPAYKAYWRVLKRYFKYRGTSRPDTSVGCNEKLDWSFTKWIFKDGRQPRHKENYQQIQKQYGDKVVVLNSQKAIDDFIRGEKEKYEIR